MYATTGAPRELKAMQYSDMPKGGCETDYAHLVEGMRILENKIDIENRILKNKVESLKKQDDKMNEFEGLDYKVAYLMQIKGYSVKEVASELGYVDSYIGNISARVNKGA